LKSRNNDVVGDRFDGMAMMENSISCGVLRDYRGGRIDRITPGAMTVRLPSLTHMQTEVGEMAIKIEQLAELLANHLSKEDKKTVQLIVEQGLADQFGSTGARVLKSIVARKKNDSGNGVRAKQCQQES